MQREVGIYIVITQKSLPAIGQPFLSGFLARIAPSGPGCYHSGWAKSIL